MPSIQDAANIAQVIIAAGTVFGFAFSVWFSVKSLRKSDWNTSMMTAPSLTIRCFDISLGLSASADPQQGYQWGEPTRQILRSENYIILNLTFAVENKGRGLALGIQKPTLESKVEVMLHDDRLPTSIGANEDSASTFEAQVRMRHDDWIALGNGPLYLKIKIDYINDQGSVQCSSFWSGDVVPFDIDGTTLIVRQRREVGDITFRIDYKARK